MEYAIIVHLLKWFKIILVSVEMDTKEILMEFVKSFVKMENISSKVNAAHAFWILFMIL